MTRHESKKSIKKALDFAASIVVEQNAKQDIKPLEPLEPKPQTQKTSVVLTEVSEPNTSQENCSSALM